MKLRMPWRRTAAAGAPWDPAALGGRAYSRWVARFDTMSPADLDAMKRMATSMTSRPLISVVIPVAPTSADLAAAVQSVVAQAYEHWELHVAIPDSASPDVRDIATALSTADARIAIATPRSVQRPVLCNAGLELARGDLIAVVDPAGTLAPHALLMVAAAIDENPQAILVYSDEDELDDRGSRRAPNFKPDWNPALLLSTGYVGRLTALRAQAVREAGGFRPDFEGCEELDLVLRVTRDVEASRIVHVPHVLYHQRSGAPRRGWPAAGDAVSAGIAARAVSDHLMTSGVAADVELGPRGVVRVRYQLPEPAPPVRVIVPTTMGHESTTCLQGLLERTHYDALSVTVAVADADLDPASQSRLARFSSDPRVDVFVYPKQPFNYSGINNAAIARGDTAPIICLLNDDVEVIEPRWLKTMVGQVLQPGVGAVGARLLYPDGHVQHAGVMLGVLGVAAPAHQTLAREDAGYQGRAVADQDLSCVTAACLVIRSDAFEEVGGFDEQLAIAFNDVDLCIRLKARGWRVVLAAGAELFHAESVSVGLPHANHRSEQFGRERRLMKDRWGGLLTRDPHYSPNLDLRRPGELAAPPRLPYAWH